jgi:Na+/melibiose symporter-like transporter
METQAQKAGEARLPLWRIAVFSLPVLAIQAVELPWRLYLPSFFSQGLGLPLARVGTLLMAIRLFDMVLDPVVGWASDRFPTRLGMRRPWMAAGVPLMLVGAWQVFFARDGVMLPLLAAWCVVMHVGYTMMVTPHGGWGLELSADPHERTRIMGARVWFGALAMPLILAVPGVMERLAGAGQRQQVQAMGAVLMVLACLSTALVLRFIPEPPVDHAAARRTAGPLRQFAVILRDRSLLTILCLYALLGLADASSGATFIFFVEQALDLKGWASTLMPLQGLVVIATVPVWEAISRRIGKRRTLMAVYGWQVLTVPVALVLPEGQVGPLAVFLLLRNLSWGADYMLLRAMVADVSGRDAERGMRRSGSYYALFNVTLKLAMALGVGAALWVLALADFVPGAAAEGSSFMVLRLVYALPSVVAGLVAVAILAFDGRPVLSESAVVASS